MSRYAARITVDLSPDLDTGPLLTLASLLLEALDAAEVPVISCDVREEPTPSAIGT